jgi:hypothetical protein
MVATLSSANAAVHQGFGAVCFLTQNSMHAKPAGELDALVRFDEFAGSLALTFVIRKYSSAKALTQGAVGG